jgi:2-C-methyl-D-erythritol 4-phosphate cytidylyltransferase
MGWVAILAAAGTGSRLGRGQAKALVELGGKPLLVHALESLRAAGFARTVVAAPAESLGQIEPLLADRESVVSGGATRAESVRRAFEALDAQAGDIVCIHDAARPFVSVSEIADVMNAAERDGAAIAATPIVDTLKRVDGGKIAETVDRRGLWAAATPQAFRVELLRRALAPGSEATDEAALCERLGIPVAIAAVSRLAFKVTTPEDLELAEAILLRRDA